MSLRDAQSTDGWRAFGHGFHQRHPLVLLVAALMTVGVIFALQGLLFDGGLTAVDEGRLLRIAHDDYVHVSVRVQQLRKDPPTTRTIYLFGGSGTMESFISEASLATAIRRESGQHVQVVSLAAHQESMAMSLALVDNLPPGPATLALGLAPIRVTGAPERDAELLSSHTLLLRSPRLEKIAPRYFGKKAPTTGAIPGIFDYVGSYLRERAAGDTPWGGRIIYETHYYPWGAKGHTQFGKRHNVLYVLEKDVRLYRKYADYNFAMLEEILRLAEERGFDVVLYDQPLNAFAAGADWSGVVPAYRKRARALAEKYDVPYVNIGRDVELTDWDFADLFHLLAQGRLKWQPEMARRLAFPCPCPTARSRPRRPPRVRQQRCNDARRLRSAAAAPRYWLRGGRHAPPVPHRRRRAGSRRGGSRRRRLALLDRARLLVPLHRRVRRAGDSAAGLRGHLREGHAVLEAPGGAGRLRHRLPARRGRRVEPRQGGLPDPDLSARPQPAPESRLEGGLHFGDYVADGIEKRGVTPFAVAAVQDQVTRTGTRARQETTPWPCSSTSSSRSCATSGA